MCVIGLIFFAVLYCTAGSAVIIWPDQVKQRLSHASRASIRWYGIIIFGAGVWLAIAAVLLNSALALVRTLMQ